MTDDEAWGLVRNGIRSGAIGHTNPPLVAESASPSHLTQVDQVLQSHPSSTLTTLEGHLSHQAPGLKKENGFFQSMK